MKFFYSALAFLLFTAILTAAGEKWTNLPVAGNLYVAINSSAGHQTPIVEFFRRYERVCRLTGNFNSTQESQPLILMLNIEQPPGSCRFVYSKQLNARVLQLPPDLDNILHSPRIGRHITMALLQSRMNQAPHHTPRPEMWWIADGIWAEFLQRETMNFPILNFNYQPELRILAERGFRMRLNLDTLTPPEILHPRNAEFVLYSQRAQLMVKVADSINTSRRGNLLKEYCVLLNGGKLPPEECFNMIFGTAAAKKLNMPLPRDMAKLPADKHLAVGYEALEKMALRTLFSAYAPMSPDALKVRFRLITQLVYQPEKSPNRLRGELSDLPLIVKNHPECSGLIQAKIRELNEFLLLTPVQLRTDVINLVQELNRIDVRNVQRSSHAIKQHIAHIDRKLNDFQTVDQELQQFEQPRQALFYPLRYSINGALSEEPMTSRIKLYLDQQERLLMQQ